MKKINCFSPDKSYGTDTSVKEWLSANAISQPMTGPAGCASGAFGLVSNTGFRDFTFSSAYTSIEEPKLQLI